jgi:hypothetical protein
MEEPNKTLAKELLEHECGDEHPAALKVIKIILALIIMGIAGVCLSKLYLGW